MDTVRVVEKSGTDGMLTLRIPTGRPETEFDVVIAVQPRCVDAAPEGRGWPPGYFDKTFGSVTDDTFARPPQGELPRFMELD